MSTRSPVFAQIMQALDPTEFARCAARFPAPRRPRSLSAYDHFLALCFGQLTWRESLRDLVICLNARTARAYHLGLRSDITRTNLAYANAHRDWRLFAEVAQLLMRRARRLYLTTTPTDPELPALAYALDASLIDLSLSLFPWAHWKERMAAMKLHTLLSLRGSIPAWCLVTEATCPEQITLDQLPLEPGAFYVMDRGYLDFERLHMFQRSGAFFVTRTKSNVLMRRRYSRNVDFSTGLISDHTVVLKTAGSFKHDPDALRRVRYRDVEQNRTLVFLTNNFGLPALTVAQLYKPRWKVELFFKWIKQHLRIKAFYGNSENAVKAQIWTAIAVYVLVAILKKRLALDASLFQILQVLSVTLFEKTPILRAFDDTGSIETPEPNSNLTN